MIPVFTLYSRPKYVFKYFHLGVFRGSAGKYCVTIKSIEKCYNEDKRKNIELFSNKAK